VNKFSKILTIAMVLAISAGFGGAVLEAATGEAKDSPIKNINNIVTILNNIVKYMYQIFFIIAIGAVLWAAFTYLTAKDDPEKIKSATKQILWAAVAIAIALVSVGANVIINNLIGGGSSGGGSTQAQRWNFLDQGNYKQ